MDYSVTVSNPLNGQDYRYDFNLSMQKDDSAVFSPGVASTFSLIPTFIESIQNFFEGIRYRDREQIIEHLVRAFSLPLGIASGLERIISFMFLIIMGISYVALTFQSCILGLIFLVIELGLEIGRLCRTIAFNSNFHIKTAHYLLSALDCVADIQAFVRENKKELKLFISEKVLDEIMANSVKEDLTADLQRLIIQKTTGEIHHRYFSLSEEETQKILRKAGYDVEKIRVNDSLHVINADGTEFHSKEDDLFVEELVKARMQTKLNAFARRIRPWGVHNFYTHMNHSKRLSIIDGRELISMINTQLDKTQLVHIVGIIALSLSTISIVFSMILFPFAIPLVLGLAGVVVELLRFAAPNVFLDQKGWNLSWTACLPDWLTGNHPQRHVPKEPSSVGQEMVDIKTKPPHTVKDGSLDSNLGSFPRTPTDDISSSERSNSPWKLDRLVRTPDIFECADSKT